MTDRGSASRRNIFVLVALGAIIVGAVFVVSGRTEPGEEPLTGVGVADIGDPLTTYDPVRAGEQLPDGFRQIIRRDVIRTVYQPVFVTAGEVEWDPATLVIGVAFGDDARAYPINYMNVHEMVDDTIGGTPVLVSW